MTTYVDTSVLIKLLVAEEGSDRAQEVWRNSPLLASVTLVIAESAAALASAERAGRVTPVQHSRLLISCGELIDQMTLVQVTDDLVARAAALARQEGLRGYDAVHLAAALTVGAIVLTSADAALCRAAQSQGLHVADPCAV